MLKVNVFQLLFVSELCFGMSQQFVVMDFTFFIV